MGKYKTMFGEEIDGEYVYYVEPRTKQSFKDQCDINRVMDKAKRTGVLAHVNKHEGFYGDALTDFDYEAAQIEIAKTNSVFYELDAELRREFDNKPGKFRDFVATNSVDEILEKFPKLAETGKQFPDVVGGGVKEEPPVVTAEVKAAPVGDGESADEGGVA